MVPPLLPRVQIPVCRSLPGHHLRARFCTSLSGDVPGPVQLVPMPQRQEAWGGGGGGGERKHLPREDRGSELHSHAGVPNSRPARGETGQEGRRVTGTTSVTQCDRRPREAGQKTWDRKRYYCKEIGREEFPVPVNFMKPSGTERRHTHQSTCC